MKNGGLDLAGVEKADVNDWVIRPYSPQDAVAWKALLAESNNATLFHDLDFLAYHPPGRHDFRHLVALRRNRIDAVIPGALSADGMFVSTAGASIGGPAVIKSMTAEACLQMVEALQRYCKTAGWQGIEITLPPPVYHDEPDQLIEFALHMRGFQLVHRSMPLLIPLDRENSDDFEQSFRERQRRYVRACRRKGVAVTESDIDGLSGFLELLEETHSRLRSLPTHTPAEIQALLHRVPGHLRIWSAHLGGLVIASTLLFILNRNVCNTFYLCDRASHRSSHGATVLVAEVMNALGKRGYRYLDMGPSASTTHFNHGVVGFKESLGAKAFCRDRWRWSN
ncbi:MAG: GNAT family N-acetyltransferase [Alphaproteobacteria bacterium]|nr:GNAT family N-acetyltransferase [Alphaproteobacteria bacterium]